MYTYKNPTLTKFISTDLDISKTSYSIHNDAKEILKRAHLISEKLGIVDDTFYRDHTTMTNFIYTNAPVHKMVHAVVMYDVLYYLDDFFGEDTLQGEAIDLQLILDIWEGKSLAFDNQNKHGSCLLKSLYYISNSLREDSNSLFFAKYTKSMKEHLWHAIKSPSFSTVNEYMGIRLHTGGMLPVIDLMEYMNDCHLEIEILEKVPSLKRLRNTCAMIGALSNDLFSYAKEKHSDFNLINAYLITKEAASFEDAVQKAITLVNRLYQEYLDLINKTHLISLELNKENKSILNNYLNGLNSIISACYHWQISTDRYMHDENIFLDMRR